MNRINWILSLYSLNALVIITERLSFTTQVVLQPYSFLRLHELIQGPILLTISVILSFFVFREVSNNFSYLKRNLGFLLGVVFISGVYLYGLGEGWHEVASFTFNHYCDVDNFTDELCGGLFINDYYIGNLLFFAGAIASSIAILTLERFNPQKVFTTKQIVILLLNGLVYAFTFFAYAAFDRVLIGLYSSAILMVFSVWLFIKVRKDFRRFPYITYSAFAYTLATVAAFVVRLIK